jgi:hypothetical protein
VGAAWTVFVPHQEETGAAPEELKQRDFAAGRAPAEA